MTEVTFSLQSIRSFGIVKLLIPIFLLALAIVLRPFCDYLRDRFFFLFARQTKVVYYGQEFKKLLKTDAKPDFVKWFFYTSEKAVDRPSNYLYDVGKFLKRCFPTNDIDKNPDYQLSDYFTYFWYFSVAGKNIPLTLVSVVPFVIDYYHLIRIYNGCVAGSLRGLGYGPNFFIQAVVKYMRQDAKVPVTDPYKFYFSYSVQVKENPFSVQTCASYLSTGVLKWVHFGKLPYRTAEVLSTLQEIEKNFDRFSVVRCIEAYKNGTLDGLLDELMMKNHSRHDEIAMYGTGDIADSRINVERSIAEGVCRKLVAYVNAL